MFYFSQLKVTHPDDTPAADEPIEMCLSAKSEFYEFHHQRTEVRLMCKNYTSDEQGMINFILPPHKPSVVSFNVEVTFFFVHFRKAQMCFMTTMMDNIILAFCSFFRRLR